jgi:capsular polysaccharide export protein
VPPFPGSRPHPFDGPTRGDRTSAELDAALALIFETRAAGIFWGSRPRLPDGPYALVCVTDEAKRRAVIAAISAEQPIVCLGVPPKRKDAGKRTVVWLSDRCDPWHLVDGAARVFGDADDALMLVAVLAGKEVSFVGDATLGEETGLRDWLRSHPTLDYDYSDPFSGEPITLPEAVKLCSFWRNLIDSNRPIVAALGFAAWKRPTVAPLLWAGSTDVAFVSTAAKIRAGDEVAVWKSRVGSATLADLLRRKAHLIEVEDGFIRSVGLGAECVPPLSIVVDRIGVYFDPSGPSELERLVEQGDFSSALLDRARSLREVIVTRGVSKYEFGTGTTLRKASESRHVLVVGQVEDDRSMMSGGGAVATNMELLRRARELAPDAHVIYKPHPDVEAGHRVGAVPQHIALSFADEVVRDQPIGALIDMVDEVHVNTSLAGFEALLRGRAVTTHGVPFYAGWGLTRDLGNVPARRTARRSLDELVAAVLLLYPRYLDPETGLPCPPEILIRRLTSAAGSARDGWLVKLRRLQGRARRGLASLREWRHA